MEPCTQQRKRSKVWETDRQHSLPINQSGRWQLGFLRKRIKWGWGWDYQLNFRALGIDGGSCGKQVSARTQNRKRFFWRDLSRFSSFTQPFVSIQPCFFFTFVSIPNIVLWFLLGTHIQTHEEVAIKLVSSLLRFYICFFFLASCACY